MTLHNLGRWALTGLGPEGRFLLERWLVKPDFPFVAVSDPSPPPANTALSWTPNFDRLIDDSTLRGVVVTSPFDQRGALIHQALSAGKNVLVSGRLGQSPDEAREIDQRAEREGRLVGVFQVHRADFDFHAARAAMSQDRIGPITVVRRIDCEYGLAAMSSGRGSPVVWKDAAYRLLDQLLRLIAEKPSSVEAWTQSYSGGIQARIEFSGGAAAWLDVQRTSLAGLQTGWVVEGTHGAYRAGRLMTVAADGEVVEEDVVLPADFEDDVMSDLRRLASDAQAGRESRRRSLQVIDLLDAMERSAAPGCRVVLDDSASR
jgi:predicted dehydrogenase